MYFRKRYLYNLFVIFIIYNLAKGALMIKNRLSPEPPDEEILEADAYSSPDAWIQPEMLRKLAEKTRIMNGETTEEK